MKSCRLIVAAFALHFLHDSADIPDVLRDEGELSDARRLAYVTESVVEILKQEDTLIQRSTALPVEAGGLTMGMRARPDRRNSLLPTGAVAYCATCISLSLSVSTLDR
jgi:hypothetical protein